MSHVVFLAPVQDPVTPTKVYGKDHTESIVNREVQLRNWQAEGKVSLLVPEARQIRVTPIATTTATVNWVVDQPSYSMRVDYGTTGALGSQQAATPANGTGAVVANLTGLTTGTLYYYAITVHVSGLSAWTTSPQYTFTTL